jgi:hypothetical protein
MTQPQLIRDLVVVIPGILGSVLVKDGREVWGASGRSVIDNLLTFGRAINVLKLKPGIGHEDPHDGIIASRALPHLCMIPIARPRMSQHIRRPTMPAHGLAIGTIDGAAVALCAIGSEVGLWDAHNWDWIGGLVFKRNIEALYDYKSWVSAIALGAIGGRPVAVLARGDGAI